MTIRELIEQLKAVNDPYATVLVDGFEKGYDDIGVLRRVAYVPNRYHAIGPHGKVEKENMVVGKRYAAAYHLTRRCGPDN